MNSSIVPTWRFKNITTSINEFHYQPFFAANGIVQWYSIWWEKNLLLSKILVVECNEKKTKEIDFLVQAVSVYLAYERKFLKSLSHLLICSHLTVNKVIQVFVSLNICEFRSINPRILKVNCTMHLSDKLACSGLMNKQCAKNLLLHLYYEHWHFTN